MILVHTNAFLFLIIWKQSFPIFQEYYRSTHICFYSFARSETFRNIREEQRKKFQGRWLRAAQIACLLLLNAIFISSSISTKSRSTCQRIPGAWTFLGNFF